MASDEQIEAALAAFRNYVDPHRAWNAAIDASTAPLTEALEKARGALDALAKLGNGESYGNSVGNVMALQALAEINKALGRE